MDEITASKFSMISSNPCTPLEEAFSIRCAEIIITHKYPVERINVAILFKDVMRIPSDINLKLERDNDDVVVGKATLMFNSLFINQDPKVYFEDVCVHEVAHLFTLTSTFKNNEKDIKAHGQEWRDWHDTIDPSCTPNHKIESMEFDNRACLSRAGGCIASCSCDDGDYKAFGMRSAEYNECTEGELMCNVCGAPYVVVPPSSVTGKLSEDIKFLHFASGFRKIRDIKEIVDGFVPSKNH